MNDIDSEKELATMLTSIGSRASGLADSVDSMIRIRSEYNVLAKIAIHKVIRCLKTFIDLVGNQELWHNFIDLDFNEKHPVTEVFDPMLFDMRKLCYHGATKIYQESYAWAKASVQTLHMCMLFLMIAPRTELPYAYNRVIEEIRTTIDFIERSTESINTHDIAVFLIPVLTDLNKIDEFIEKPHAWSIMARNARGLERFGAMYSVHSCAPLLCGMFRDIGRAIHALTFMSGHDARLSRNVRLALRGLLHVLPSPDDQ